MTNGRIAKYASIIMLATILSRFLGYVWKALLSAFFFGSTSDTFFRANTLPNMLYNILVGVLLSALFIPFFTRYLVKEEKEELWRLFSSLFILLFLVLLILSGLGILFAPQLSLWLNPTSNPGTIDLTAKLTQIMFPALLFLGWAGLLTALLNAFQNFTVPALSVVAFNVVLIVLITILAKPFNIFSAAIGWTCAAMAQFLFQVPSLLKQGFRLSLSRLWHPDLKKIAILALPLLISAAIDQLSPFFEARLTSFLEAGSFTALRNAGVLVQLPLGIFAMSITTAIYPTLTEQLATGEMNEAKESIRWSIGASSLFILPSAVGLIALSVPIIRVLYQYGEFTPIGTSLSAYALRLYAPGLFANATLMVLLRAFYAMQDTFTPVLITFGGLALQIALYFALIGPLKVGGLALAATLAAYFNLTLMTLFLRRKIGPLRLETLIPSLSKMLVSATIMGLACYFLDRLMVNFLSPDRVLFRVAEAVIVIGFGLALYLLLLYLLKVKEVIPVFQRIKRVFRGFAVAQGGKNQ
ncbi:MAG: murein biosynthesis integral membrane protein MurJ [bacterium]